MVQTTENAQSAHELAISRRDEEEGKLAALREMIAPGVLAITAPVIVGMLFGPTAPWRRSTYRPVRQVRTGGGPICRGVFLSPAI